ncbi:MAG TPA: acVLRF1 family peptidyl-tRNA hydrolase [Micrococcaceae bacterium]
MTAVSRTAFVAPGRIPGWLDRFAAGHGPVQLEETDDGVRLTAADGAGALLQAPWPVDGRPGRGTTPIERLLALAGQSRTIAVVLLRRGGYAVGLCRDGQVLVSKIGTRYVQSRTAAGGWSQQRFARRRTNQADALVEAVAEHAARVLTPGAPGGGPSGTAEYLVLGGDKALCQSLLVEPVFGPLAVLPRLAFLDVPDPKSAVLKQAAADLHAVRIRVSDPPGSAV